MTPRSRGAVARTATRIRSELRTEGFDSRRASTTCLALLVVGCGADPGDAPGLTEAPSVFAFPSGRIFEDRIDVSLQVDVPATIYYTLDGSAPTGAEARVYDGPLTLLDGALLSFVAEGSDGRWSPLGSELYERVTPPAPFRPVERGLELSDDVIFFSAEPGEVVLEQEVELRSIGLTPVRIDAVYIAAQGAYFEPHVFEVLGAGVTSLPPGESLVLTVRYNVTKTLRTGALVVDTDGLRARDGRWVVTLGGRISPL